MQILNESNRTRLPLKSQFVCETDDLIATRDHLAKYLGRHTINPLDKNYCVSFQHCGINIGRIGINSLYYGTAIRIGVCPPENTFFMLVLLRGTGLVKQQDNVISLSGRDVYMFNPGVPAVLDLSNDMMNFTVKVSQRGLQQILERESGKTLSSELLFNSADPGTSHQASGLMNLLVHACNEIDKGHVDLRLPIVEKQWEELIYAQILAELSHNQGELVGAPATGQVPDYIRRVENYISDHYRDVIQLFDLARCAAVSERALQNGFRRYRNTTPMEYLRDFRLGISRQKLLDARYADNTISEIATDCGFSHLSKYAKCYRERFGETPSITRRKSQ